MVMPILTPVLEAANFDLIWFAVILTINMEVGLITPPVGLNLYVLKGVAPQVPLTTVLKGSFPFVLIMLGTIVSDHALPPDRALAAQPDDGKIGDTAAGPRPDWSPAATNEVRPTGPPGNCR